MSESIVFSEFSICLNWSFTTFISVVCRLFKISSTMKWPLAVVSFSEPSCFSLKNSVFSWKRTVFFFLSGKVVSFKSDLGLFIKIDVLLKLSKVYLISFELSLNWFCSSLLFNRFGSFACSFLFSIWVENFRMSLFRLAVCWLSKNSSFFLLNDYKIRFSYLFELKVEEKITFYFEFVSKMALKWLV